MDFSKFSKEQIDDAIRKKEEFEKEIHDHYWINLFHVWFFYLKVIIGIGLIGFLIKILLRVL